MQAHRGEGHVADYIPALARVDARGFGLAVITCAGETFETGDAWIPFSIQSISKVFTLTLALERLGETGLERSLAPYPVELRPLWHSLTDRIHSLGFPAELQQEQVEELPADLSGERLAEYLLRQPSRIERALERSHQGSWEDLLGEFQFAFVRFYLDDAAGAFRRWRHLLLSFYGAGAEAVARHPYLFETAVRTIRAQLERVPDDWFRPEGFVHALADDFIEDLRRTGLPPLSAAGHEFREYLAGRRGRAHARRP